MLSRKQTEAPQLQGWDWKSRVPEPFTLIHFQKVRQKRIPCYPPLTTEWGPETGVAACPVCKALGSFLRREWWCSNQGRSWQTQQLVSLHVHPSFVGSLFLKYKNIFYRFYTDI